jgi:TonB family protein
VIKCRPADANPRVLRRLKDLGLVRVFLGVESASSSGLADLERTQTVEDSERALETCASLDISAQFTLMIFHPDATLDTLRSDVAFMRRFAGNPLNFCRAEIYAGTPLEKRMIALGRARGDYLARVYSLSDPVADLACNTSLDLFEARCWSGGSLMQTAIGLDHLAAVLKRFNRKPAAGELCQRVGSWLRSVNVDNADLLDEVLDRSAAANASSKGASNARCDASFKRAVLALRERESRTRDTLLAQGSNLRADLEALRFPSQPRQFRTFPGSHLRLARQAAVAVLAIGMPAMSGCQSGVSEMAPPPLRTQTPQDNQCSLSGTVTDSSGAVVTHVTITITNLDTGLNLTLKPNEVGQYAASDLQSGRYTVRAEAAGFKTTLVTGIVLKSAERGHADIKLQAGNYGCCEYAAGPLKVGDLTLRQKPFTYIVGDVADHNTFQGIARQVYGDSKLWVQIFEANRNVVEKPGFIPNGTSILIPPKKRAVPKLISKVAPVYPPAAASQHVHGDVVLDITLKEDGTVDAVNVIDGNAVLADAATTAVKQWRYQPLLVQGKPVLKFVIVVSFGKDGKVH